MGDAEVQRHTILNSALDEDKCSIIQQKNILLNTRVFSGYLLYQTELLDPRYVELVRRPRRHAVGTLITQ
jgi:hypothetical protein